MNIPSVLAKKNVSDLLVGAGNAGASMVNNRVIGEATAGLPEGHLVCNGLVEDQAIVHELGRQRGLGPLRCLHLDVVLLKLCRATPHKFLHVLLITLQYRYYKC